MPHEILWKSQIGQTEQDELVEEKDSVTCQEEERERNNGAKTPLITKNSPVLHYCNNNYY